MDSTPQDAIDGLEAARSAHRQLEQLVTVTERGESDESTLQAIKLLCDSVILTIDDPLCQEKICAVEQHAEELFRLDWRPRWGRAAPPGAAFLRRLMFRALSAFDDRLKELEKAHPLAKGAADCGIHATV